MTRLPQYRTREACAALLVVLLVCLAPACAASGRGSAPERAARSFLAAVAAGKATEALTFLREAPTDSSLLTDEVLADAVSQAPVTKIVASQRGGGDAENATVDVSYQVDGVPVTDTYQMVQVDGQWLLDETLPKVPKYSDHPSTVGVTVGGVVTEAGEDWTGSPSRALVLPGRYQFGLDHPMLEVDDADFTVLSLHAPVALTGSGPQTHLTADASQKVATAAADTLTACLKDTTLSTPCGFSSDGTYVEDAPQGARAVTIPAGGTAAWSLEPGGTDLATTRPDWGFCGRWAEQAGVCVDGIRVAARLVVRSSTGVEVTLHRSVLSSIRSGYVADISDPDQIRIAFLGF